MASCTYSCFLNVINIGNSIIGVSILAMPYCFRKCGILLSLLLILISGILTRIACYLLLKSAIMSRRRNFEFLAFHTLGPSGKLAVEMCVIGFLIGVCIAFFVVIGDLGPPLAAEFLNIQNVPNLRTNVLMLVGLCVALPLGMLRKIDSLTSLSALSIAFYGFLVLKIFTEAVPNLLANEWWYEVNWWKTDGILSCLPIFSMALSCQTQLFEFFDTMNDPSLKRMQSVVSGAVHLCSAVYILVGTFGYIAFHNKVITGNALIFLTPSIMTEFIKLGFILTVAVSFPLCLFPCRSSLHSLLFKQGFGHHDLASTVIPDHRFRILTVSLVIVTIGIAIMLPNIEFVLGIIGSTIGTLICLIFPAVVFIHDTSKNTAEKRMAQMLMCIGVFILVACTYTTLQEGTEQRVTEKLSVQIKEAVPGNLSPESLLSMSAIVSEVPPSPAYIKTNVENNEKGPIEKSPDVKIPNDQKRLEPPVPQEPEAKADQNADLDPQALQKEDKELQKEVHPTAANFVEPSNKNKGDLDKQQQLLERLEEQHKEQKIILEQQKKVLEELKLHKESHQEQKKVDLGQENIATVTKVPSVPDLKSIPGKKENEQASGNQKIEQPKVPDGMKQVPLPIGKKIQLDKKVILPFKNVTKEIRKLSGNQVLKKTVEHSVEMSGKMGKNETFKETRAEEVEVKKNTSFVVPLENMDKKKEAVKLSDIEQENLKKSADAHIAQRETLGEKNLKENVL